MNMKEVKSNCYLGCLLSSSVRESVTDTVDSRIGLAKRSIYEIRNVVEDCRANSLGAIQVVLDLWRGSVLSSLLAGCEVWTDITPKTMKKLEYTNSLFLANLFGVSKRGCPEASLYIESSSLLIPNQILLSQLLFIHHIATLPLTSLARETFEEMKIHNYPGLLKNLEKHLRE